VSRTECCFVAPFYKFLVIARAVEWNASWFAETIRKTDWFKTDWFKNRNLIAFIVVFFRAFEIKTVEEIPFLWKRFIVSSEFSDGRRF